MEEIRPEEEIQEQEVQEQKKNVYNPRPSWQVWAARIGVVIMLIGFILYCLHIAGIGL